MERTGGGLPVTDMAIPGEPTTVIRENGAGLEIRGQDGKMHPIDQEYAQRYRNRFKLRNLANRARQS